MTIDERTRFEKAGRIVELMAEISELGDRERALAGRAEPSGRREWVVCAENKRAAIDEKCTLRNELADEFGARYGWSQVRAGCCSFDRLMTNPWRYHRGGWYLPWDHPYFYRRGDRGRRLMAVAVHVYDTVDPVKLEATAEALGMTARIILPDEFPSWWWPGRTTLLLYTAAGTLQ